MQLNWKLELRRQKISLILWVKQTKNRLTGFVYDIWDIQEIDI